MVDVPRRRALIDGKRVEFQSRNLKLASVRWHTRFKLTYRTVTDATNAAEIWERKARILFPEDLKPAKQKHESRVAPAMRRRREIEVQHEMRL